MEIELGRAKRARRAYTFDDIAVVPSRRTRNPEDVSTAWTIDAFQFAIPVLGRPDGLGREPRAPPSCSASSAGSACSTSRVSGPATTTRSRCWPRSPASTKRRATQRMQELYAEPIKPELVRDRLAEIRAAGVTVAGALTPQRTQELYETVVAAGVDLFVIRGTTVSAEHVSSVDRAPEPQEVHLRPRRARHRRRCRRPTPPRCTSCAPEPPACSSASAGERHPPRAPPSASTRRWRPRSPTSPALAATTSTSRADATCT